MREQEFHQTRRAFFVFPNGVYFFQNKSHLDWLTAQGFPNNTMQIYPRGYYMDNNVVFYQGASMQFGANLGVAAENIKYIEKYYPQIQQKYKLDGSEKIYLGVVVGARDTIWERINPMRYINGKMLPKQK